MKASIDEVFVSLLARTIEDGELAFHGGSSPMAAIALKLAKEKFVDELIYVGGNPTALEPDPAFIPTTTHDWTLTRGATTVLGTDYLFDLGCAGRIDRMFLSGAQIDKYGNTNVTAIGPGSSPKVKLPGGGGGAYLSSTVRNLTLWTTNHEPRRQNGKDIHSLVDEVDVVTAFGHRRNSKYRPDLDLKGNGPQWLITEWGIFDFPEPEYEARLCRIWPDVRLEKIVERTAFDPDVSSELKEIPMPDSDTIEFIRDLDPLEVRKTEFLDHKLNRSFQI